MPPKVERCVESVLEENPEYDESRAWECEECSDTFDSEQGLKVHVGRKHTDHPEKTEPCPTCGEKFVSYKGVQIHRSRAHGEDVTGVTITCEWCGDTKRKRATARQSERNFCGHACYGEWLSENRSGENHPGWNGGKATVHCSVCGEPKQVKRYKLDVHDAFWCSTDCEGIWKTENQTGENHPRWKGGAHKNYRGDWYKVRKERLEIDGYGCVICGRGVDELGEEPAVHHIQPVTSFDDPNDAHTIENTRTVCLDHHNLVEGWQIFPKVSARA